jgi:hypothetical protein
VVSLNARMVKEDSFHLILLKEPMGSGRKNERWGIPGILPAGKASEISHNLGGSWYELPDISMHSDTNRQIINSIIE